MAGIVDAQWTPQKAKVQQAKEVVLAFHEALALEAGASPERTRAALEAFYDPKCKWHGVAPFDVIDSDPVGVARCFYDPLLVSFGRVQRRDDVFFAGFNVCDPAKDAHDQGAAGAEEVWVHSSGHLLGLFDKAWLDIPPTGRLCFVRYCEFSCVDLAAQKITKACVHVDVLSVMHQAGVYPLPPPTGALLACTPGPRSQDGVQRSPAAEHEAQLTVDCVQGMLDKLTELNKLSQKSGSNQCPPSVLEEHWHSDMLWFGPAGIGATGLSIPRYQRQHQMPFRENLYEKTYHGHIARFAEGDYLAFFGWPNLTNRASGGFLGLPGDGGSEHGPKAGEPAEWRIVDVYRRAGDKLAENWVMMDQVHYLKCRGLDVLKRMRELQVLGDADSGAADA